MKKQQNMLKKTMFFSVLIVFLGSCSSLQKENKQKNANLTGEPIIEFQKKQHNFGIVIEGEKVIHHFKFKNIGNNNLIITNVSASCGCTVPSFSSEPITPNNTGEIEVIFDSNYRIGKQQKTLSVWTNAQKEAVRLTVTCEVIKAQ